MVGMVKKHFILLFFHTFLASVNASSGQVEQAVCVCVCVGVTNFEVHCKVLIIKLCGKFI